MSFADKRAREKLKGMKTGEKTDAFEDYHADGTTIKRNTPKRHMSKKERRLQKRLGYTIVKGEE